MGRGHRRLARRAGRWTRVAVRRREVGRLRTETRASWQEAFVTYQRAYFLPFAETLRAAYQRFIDGRPGLPLTWEQATQEARWPRHTPLPSGVALREWRSLYGIDLEGEDELLLRFCEAIYPPAEASNLQAPRSRSIMTPEEFEVFHRARAGIADYFDQCGSRRALLPEFKQFLEREVRPNHYHRLKIVAYLEIALAQARPEFSEAGREHSGLFRLGDKWRADDTREEKPPRASTSVTEKRRLRRIA